MKTAGLLLALTVVAALALLALRDQKPPVSAGAIPINPGASLPRIVLGLPTQISMANWFVALEQGYFAEAGVDLVNQPHAVGLQALDAVLAGKADLAVVADTPVMFAVMNGAEISLVASTFASRPYMALLARGDRGIVTAADLKGKKIGYIPKTSGHFFAYTFLLANGVGAGKALPTPITPAELLPLIRDGELDAVATWEPILSEVRAALGGNAVQFLAPEIYTTRFNLVGRTGYVREHEPELRAILGALQRASRFIAREPEQVRQSAQRYMQVKDPRTIPAPHPQDYEISLDQGLLNSFEDQARWAMKEKLVTERSLPNFLRHVDAAAMLAISPATVTLVQ